MMSVATGTPRSSRASSRRKKALFIETDDDSPSAGGSGFQAQARLTKSPRRMLTKSRTSSLSSQAEFSASTWSPPTPRGTITPRGSTVHSCLSPTSDRFITWSSSLPTPRGMHTPPSVHCWWDNLAAAADYLRDDVDPNGERFKVASETKWDRLTIRQWFNTMDVDHSGRVSKKEWLGFLRQNPTFRALLLNMGTALYPDRFSKISLQKLRVEAKEMKKIDMIWRELDTNKNGTLEFDEFVEIFHRTGHYFQYQDEANPREQIASFLSCSQGDACSVNSLVQLAKENLPSQTWQTLQLDTMQQISAKSPSTPCMDSQSLSCPTWARPPPPDNRAASVMGSNRQMPLRTPTPCLLQPVRARSAMGQAGKLMRRSTPPMEK